MENNLPLTDPYHLNYYGGTKLTEQLESYIKKCNIVSKKGTSNKLWEKYKYHYQQMYDVLHSTNNDFKTNLQIYQTLGEDFVPFIIIKQEDYCALSDEEKKRLSTMGFNCENYFETGDKYIGAIYRGTVYECSSFDIPELYVNIEGISHYITLKENNIIINSGTQNYTTSYPESSHFLVWCISYNMLVLK